MYGTLMVMTNSNHMGFLYMGVLTGMFLSMMAELL